MSSYTTLSPAYFRDYMMKLGWSENQVYGMMGNVQAESSFGYDRWQEGSSRRLDDRKAGYGLIQWSAVERKQKFKQLYGKEITESTPEEQMNYLDWELNNTYKKVGDRIRKSDSVSEVSTIFLKDFETPADANSQISTRAANSANWEERLKNVEPNTDIAPANRFSEAWKNSIAGKIMDSVNNLSDSGASWETMKTTILVGAAAAIMVIGGSLLKKGSIITLPK